MPWIYKKGKEKINKFEDCYYRVEKQFFRVTFLWLYPAQSFVPLLMNLGLIFFPDHASIVILTFFLCEFDLS